VFIRPTGLADGSTFGPAFRVSGCAGCGSGAFVDPNAGDGAVDELLFLALSRLAVARGRLSIEEPGEFLNAIDEGDVP
jgi:hypothetical protein